MIKIINKILSFIFIVYLNLKRKLSFIFKTGIDYWDDRINKQGFVLEDDPCYQRYKKKEIAYWSKDSFAKRTTETEGSGFLKAAPMLKSYMNWGLTGDENLEHYQFIAKFGPFKKAASLGIGEGYIEEQLLKHGVVEAFDFYDLDLKNAKKKFQAYPNCRFIEGDLNFVSLPADTYELVFEAALLHHLINIEHILKQMKKSLKRSGFLIMQDFIGERRFLWSEEKLKFLNKVFSEIPDAYKNYPGVPILRVPFANFGMSPFEAISTDSILGEIEKQSEGELEKIFLKKYVAVIFPLLAIYLKKKYYKEDNIILEKLISLDKENSQEEKIRNCVFSAVFKKR